MGKASRRKFKWKTVFLIYLISISVVVRCLPLNIDRHKFQIVENSYKNELTTHFTESETMLDSKEKSNEVAQNKNDIKYDIVNEKNYTLMNVTKNVETPAFFSIVRPGQVATSYDIDITVNDDTFEGRAIIRVEVSSDTRDEQVRFHVDGLNIQSVQYGLSTIINPQPTPNNVNGGVLQINPPIKSLEYIFLIEYTGTVGNNGYGIYRGSYDEETYLAMNLHPTYARRVFPCIDEPIASNIEINFNNAGHTNIVSNSANDGDENEAEFGLTQVPPHLWGLVAHNFQTINLPGVMNVRLLGRVNNQASYAVMMTQTLFNFLNEWTDKPYTEIDANQEGNMHVFAMPDITRDWHALSTVAIWEPYIFMQDQHSVKQQITSVIKMAESYARQWFGYVVYPENWRFAWVTTGLEIYAAYEGAAEADENLDIDSIFLTEIIQESMLMDSYSTTAPVEPENDLNDQGDIRDHMNGILRYKAPALLRMLKTVLGGEDDYLKLAASGMVNGRSLQSVNSFNFYDHVNSVRFFNDDGLINNIVDFFDPWLHNAGYPVINIGMRTGGLYITQELFSFGSVTENAIFDIPLSYTTKSDPDFDNIYAERIMGETNIFSVELEEDEWIIFNIQGQGYYRVNYHEDLWERIITAFEDPETREEIHHLNRAAILDDALNLARAGKQTYEIALRLAKSMEIELDYASWKTYVRNMDFLNKHLSAAAGAADEEEDLDTHIYRRLLGVTISAVEEEIGFYPDRLIVEDLMVSRLRGLVMEHACRVHYEPCIAAAVDWFFDPNSEEPAVNELIPHDMRPAVYCTMVREGDEAVIEALWNRFEEEPTHYERIVILEALACSHDEDFIFALLHETIDDSGRFGMEERVLFFEAVAESHLDNADIALRFIRGNTNVIRTMYGGPDRLERIIHTLAHNLLTEDLVDTFDTWIDSMNSNIDDSLDSAQRSSEIAKLNLQWRDSHFEEVYTWIEENDAPVFTLSLSLLIMTILINLFR